VEERRKNAQFHPLYDARHPNGEMSGLFYKPEIPYASRDFPKRHVKRRGNLKTSWNELLWAAITIGRPNTAYVFQHGEASLHEALFRLSLVRMALEQGPYRHVFARTDAFRGLDPTEKGAVSYFLGMTVCKLFASRLLNTPWLLHLDVFRNQLNPATLGGRSRPDLIGQDMIGNWNAFETKGRSSVPSSDDKRKAKMQAQRLVSVNGAACSLQVGSFGYFRQNELEFYWRDPEPEEPEKLEPIEIRVSDNDWAFYYWPALALATEERSDFLAVRAEAIDLKVEIHPEVHSFLLENRWAAARSRAAELGQSLRENGFQVDGLRVTAGDSWPRRFKGVSG
jgi:hypothetical protein